MIRDVPAPRDKRRPTLPANHVNIPAVGSALQFRLCAMGAHLLATATVAVVAATLVFVFWYPSPFREISGGRELFLLVIAVDLVIGPMMTFVVADQRKSRAELTRDLGMIVLIQIAALAYGLHTVAEARPAIIALEGDRLRVVRSIDMTDANFSRAPVGLKSLSLRGPTWVAARSPEGADKFDAIQRGLAGEDIGMRPELWLPPEKTQAALARAAKPLESLLLLKPARKAALDRLAASTGHPTDQLGYLPILARSTDWSALVNLRSGEVVGYVNIDGF